MACFSDRDCRDRVCVEVVRVVAVLWFKETNNFLFRASACDGPAEDEVIAVQSKRTEVRGETAVGRGGRNKWRREGRPMG